MRAFLKRLITAVTSDIRPKASAVQKTYTSYHAALKDCGSGADDLIISEVVRKKTEKFVAEINNSPLFSPDAVILTELIALLISKKANLTIIDVGGACGLHYFICKKILGEKLHLRWNVVETENMCSQGKKLATSELLFFSDLDTCAKEMAPIDLIISSGTIQYVPNPGELLQKMTKARPQFILLTRLSLSVGHKNIITIQRPMLSENGIGELPTGYEDRKVGYVHTNMSERDFNHILSTDYRAVLKFKEETGIHKVNNELIMGYGVLFERNTSL